jgi:succinyl-diaminopimelate desuccinylase
MSTGERAVALAAELVAQRSDEPAGEARIARALADRLDAAGLAVELAPFGEDGQRLSVIARLEGAGERPVCLSGHVDTVPADPAAWSRDPWSAAIEDGILHGRGACDMKGGVAAIVCAAEAWAALDGARRPPLLVVLSGGEETGCLGARALADRLGPAQALIVAEPTGNVARLGHRGVLWLRAAFPGLAAHASMPHLGRSAIRAAIRAALALDEVEHRSDPVLGRSTHNVGRIDGGTAPNLVPSRCTFDLDLRTLPGEDAASWTARLAGALGSEAELTTLLELPAVRSDAGDPRLMRATRALGLDAASGTVPFFTDASALAAALDAPTLIWGPGDAALAHAADEHCPTAQIADAAERLVAAATAWSEAT